MGRSMVRRVCRQNVRDDDGRAHKVPSRDVNIVHISALNPPAWRALRVLDAAVVMAAEPQGEWVTWEGSVEELVKEAPSLDDAAGVSVTVVGVSNPRAVCNASKQWRDMASDLVALRCRESLGPDRWSSCGWGVGACDKSGAVGHFTCG